MTIFIRVWESSPRLTGAKTLQFLVPDSFFRLNEANILWRFLVIYTYYLSVRHINLYIYVVRCECKNAIFFIEQNFITDF